MTFWYWFAIVWFACGGLAFWGSYTFDSPMYMRILLFFGGPCSLILEMFVIMAMYNGH
jgi:hypothetical protein